MASLAKRLVRAPFRAVGYDVVRDDGTTAAFPTWKARIGHAKRLGFAPRVIVDGGAFHGLWAAAARLFPGATLVLIEPNPSVHATIDANIASIRPRPTLIKSALGAEPGTARLNIWGEAQVADGASLLDHVQGEPDTVVDVSVDTLDRICERLSLTPDFVKLDLQGFESAALKGGTETLKAAELLLVEFGVLNAYEDRTTPLDLLSIADAHGFVLYDIVDCHYRPYDGALTGGDFILVKESSPLRSHRDWR
jgi:FkbM family methyltransferase